MNGQNRRHSFAYHGSTARAMVSWVNPQRITDQRPARPSFRRAATRARMGPSPVWAPAERRPSNQRRLERVGPCVCRGEEGREESVGAPAGDDMRVGPYPVRWVGAMRAQRPRGLSHEGVSCTYGGGCGEVATVVGTGSTRG